jgi:heavy metal efflux system protein
MGRRLLAFSLEQRLLVLAATVFLIGLGLWAAGILPIDAVPDITNIQVQINTSAPALSPLEVEERITFPLEVTMSGLPDVQEVRSVSKFGLSQVTVIFEDSVNIYFARQLVEGRLQRAREEILPGLGNPEIGPISTGLGEIFQYTIESPQRDLMELRTLQDWVVRPPLRTVPGVAEVNTLGGYEKQYQVLVRPDALVKYDLTLRQVFEAVAANNVNKGGGYLVKAAEQLVIRGVGQVQNLDQIRHIVIISHNGIPVRVQDVAEVQEGGAIRQGAVTQDGRGEVVTGIVMMRMGANSRVVANDVKARLHTIARSLPADVKLRPFYDRTDLVNRTIRTVGQNLIEGALLVIAVLFLLLGHIRAALIVALAIPLSMLFAVSLMVQAGVAGSLMSLGAIDFGLLVDGPVVMVENALRRLAEPKNGEPPRSEREDFFHRVLEACTEVGRPIIFGIGIIIAVYLPILTLQDIEGKLFKPMAMTVVFALIGSLLLTFLLIPVLISLFLRGPIEGKESFLIRRAKGLYERVLTGCLVHPRLVLAASTTAVAAALFTLPFLGSEFIPRLDEGAFALEMQRGPGISLEEANRLNTRMEQELLERFPDEISGIVSKTGRAEIATDPMPPSSTDLTIFLHPREHWRKAASRDALIEAIDAELKKFLGVTYEFSQPIELRMNELIAGVRSDIAIKIFGDDMDTLSNKAQEVAAAVARLPGAHGFRVQQVSGLPMLQIKVEPALLARYGINAAEVMEVVEALGGLEKTTVLEGQRRFDLVIKFPEGVRRDRESIANLLVSAPTGERVPLGALCSIEEIEGPAEISHQNGSRLIIIEGNVRGRDIGSFIEDLRRIFDDKVVTLPTGYWPEFGGQFEHLERARARLFIVVPLSLFLIFTLLFTTFNSVRQALLVFTGIPLATVGGIFALLLRGMPFSISAGVGFIALFGVAVLNGLVTVSYINKLRQEGRALAEAIREGALVRLRPVLMTALVASLGFIPMAISTGSGAEVQRPLATVVIGGLISSTLLTLLVLPLLYGLFESRAHERAGLPKPR